MVDAIDCPDRTYVVQHKDKPTNRRSHILMYCIPRCRPRLQSPEPTIHLTAIQEQFYVFLSARVSFDLICGRLRLEEAVHLSLSLATGSLFHLAL